MKGKVTAGKDKPTTVTVVIDLAKGDVGDLAKCCADCDTPHKGSKGACSATLVVDAPSLTKGNAEKVEAALKDVKGVDAKASKAQVKSKEIHVKLADKGGAKLADIKKALDDFIKK